MPAPQHHQKLDAFLERPHRGLWLMAIPVMVGMAIQTLYMIVDMIFVGMFSADALTALAFNMPLSFFAMGATFGLGTGITALVAQAVGARDPGRAVAVAQQGLFISTLMLMGFMLPGLFFGPPMLRALGVPEALMDASWSYFRVIVMGFPAMVIAEFLRAVLSGEGEVRVPVIIQGMGTVLNIALDPLFIFTFELGVAGAAIATVVAQILVALAFVVLLFKRKQAFVRLRFERFALQPPIIKQLLAVGAPASLSFIIMSTGGAAYNWVLVEVSPAAVAAHQIGNRLDHLAVLPMVALASSLVTLVGMFHGSQRTDLIIGIVRYAMSWGIGIGLMVGAVLYGFAPWVVEVFTDDAAIATLGVLYIRTVVFAYPLVPISMFTGRALQGLGKGAPLLVLTAMRVLVVTIPLAWLFLRVFRLPVQYAWLAAVIASVVTASLAVWWLVTTLRKLTKARVETLATPAPAT